MAVTALVLKLLGFCAGFVGAAVPETPSETSGLLPKDVGPVIIYGAFEEEDEESGKCSRSSSSEDLYEGHVCVICYDKKRSCFFDPCGHCATCYACAKSCCTETEFIQYILSGVGVNKQDNAALIPITDHEDAEFLSTPIAQSQQRDSPMDNEVHSNKDSPQQIHTQTDSPHTVSHDISHEPQDNPTSQPVDSSPLSTDHSGEPAFAHDNDRGQCTAAPPLQPRRSTRQRQAFGGRISGRISIRFLQVMIFLASSHVSRNEHG
nr:E3 ubiquitin-protein ligase SPL1-like [Ipomoea batatas]